MTDAISHVVVGVADLDLALEFWVGHLGLEVAARRSGADPALEAWWSLSPGAIAGQALVRTPGAATGWLHLVAFRKPRPPVRAGAAATDLGPKSIDVNCRDMPARMAALSAAGFNFRSPMSEYEVDAIRAREAQMPGHDSTNIVLIELLDDGAGVTFTAPGYAACTSFVVIVPDGAAESRFFQAVLGLDEVMHHRLTGPGIEVAVGLPPGAALDMRLLGREGRVFGRLELIQYEGAAGTNRFPLARPPATGALHVRYAVPSLQEIATRAGSLGCSVDQGPVLDAPFGRVRIAALRSPAGLRVEVFEAAPG